MNNGHLECFQILTALSNDLIAKCLKMTSPTGLLPWWSRPFTQYLCLRTYTLYP